MRCPSPSRRLVPGQPRPPQTPQRRHRTCVGSDGAPLLCPSHANCGPMHFRIRREGCNAPPRVPQLAKDVRSTSKAQHRCARSPAMSPPPSLAGSPTFARGSGRHRAEAWLCSVAVPTRTWDMSDTRSSLQGALEAAPGRPRKTGGGQAGQATAASATHRRLHAHRGCRRPQPVLLHTRPRRATASQRPSQWPGQRQERWLGAHARWPKYFTGF